MDEFERLGGAAGRILACLVLYANFAFSASGVLAEGDENIVLLKDYPAQDAAVETLRVGFFKELDIDLHFWGALYPVYYEFYQLGRKESIEIIPGNPEMSYKIWMQDEKAPLIVILPGTSVHFDEEPLGALAQVFYRQGFSVLTVSSAMNWEFMQSAATAWTPGFAPQDAADIHAALQKIFARVDGEYPGKITEKVLVGYSLGGVHALFIADIERCGRRIGFSRYIAINPPVNLFYALEKIDQFYGQWKTWSGGRIRANMSRAASVYLDILDGMLSPEKSLDLTLEQARFIIGYSFRLFLREIIFSIHKTGRSMGCIREPYRWVARQDIYREIGKYSFNGYLNTFIVKYYSEKFGREVGIDELAEKSGLRSIAGTLAGDAGIFIFHNADDFLLSEEDRKWLSGVCGSRVTFFDRGGHLGNLYLPEVQERILDSVRDLVGKAPDSSLAGK